MEHKASLNTLKACPSSVLPPTKLHLVEFRTFPKGATNYRQGQQTKRILGVVKADAVTS